MADQVDAKRRNRRIYRSLDGDRRIIERALEISAQSIRLLQDNPAPDTFLGRKRQERICPIGSDIDPQPPSK